MNIARFKIVSCVALSGALLSFAASGFAAQENRIRGPIEGTAGGNESIVLRGNLNPRARPENDRGALDVSTRIGGVKLVLGQTDRQAADLEQLLEAQRDPASADYRNWLSPEEYGERFGVSENDLAQLTSWVRSQGLAVEQVARARNWIVFSATAGQIAATFKTELHRYEAGGEKHFANASEPSIPASLAGIVVAVRGLDDFRPRPQHATFNVKPTVKPDFNASDGSHYLTPDDLATIYDIQALYKAGFDGTGQKLAIAGQTDINVADIRAFRSQFNLPVKDPQMVLAGADPGLTPDDQIEATLDLEWSGAVARNATIVYVYSQNVFESLQYAIDQNLAPAVSVSYGGCEVGSPASYRTLAQQANAQGITWLNASGDSGAAGCDGGEKVATHNPAVAFPADIPEVTAVGGTELNDSAGSFWSGKNGVNLGSALSYIPERAWNDTPLGNGLGGGGGASSLYAKPWWQTGPGVPNDQARDVPDVSLTASGAHDAYLIYANGGLMSVGGTSASSPSFAGIVAILNQYLVAKGGLTKPGLGNMNPLLYSLAQNTTGLFHDITAGDNIVPCAASVKGCLAGSYGYRAGPGYDLATGLGSVDAYSLVTKWTSLPPAVGTRSVLSASPAGIPQTATTQLTATVSAVTGSNVPTGSVTFTLGSAQLGSAVLAGSGATATATLTVKGSALAVGLDTITASYAATANFSSSTATVAVTVAAPAIGTSIAVTANPSSIALSGSTTVLTAAVKQASGSNAPAGVVAFASGSTPLGTATLIASATGSSAALAVKGASLAVGANSIVAVYGGSSSFNSSTAIPVIVTVAPPPVATTTSLTANPAAISQNTSTVLTALVRPASGNILPTGTVLFTYGNVSLGTAGLAISGSTISGSTMTATVTVKGASLPVGKDAIMASYSGSAGFTSSAGVVTVVVNAVPVATAMTVMATPTTIAPRASTQLTATVRAVTGSIGPTGSVSFAHGNIPLGSAVVTVSGGIGTAILNVKGSSLTVGSNGITATYVPAGSFGGATSSVTVNVVPAAATLLEINRPLRSNRTEQSGR